MALIIIVCVVAWGICHFKKVESLDTFFIIFITGLVGLCTASLTQTKVNTETYKNVNYYISHGKLSAYSKENGYKMKNFVRLQDFSVVPTTTTKIIDDNKLYYEGEDGNIKTGNKTYIEKRYYKVNKNMNFVVFCANGMEETVYLKGAD